MRVLESAKMLTGLSVIQATEGLNLAFTEDGGSELSEKLIKVLEREIELYRSNVFPLIGKLKTTLADKIEKASDKKKLWPKIEVFTIPAFFKRYKEFEVNSPQSTTDRISIAYEDGVKPEVAKLVNKIVTEFSEFEFLGTVPIDTITYVVDVLFNNFNALKSLTFEEAQIAYMLIHGMSSLDISYPGTKARDLETYHNVLESLKYYTHKLLSNYCDRSIARESGDGREDNNHIILDSNSARNYLLISGKNAALFYNNNGTIEEIIGGYHLGYVTLKAITEHNEEALEAWNNHLMEAEIEKASLIKSHMVLIYEDAYRMALELGKYSVDTIDGVNFASKIRSLEKSELLEVVPVIEVMVLDYIYGVTNARTVIDKYKYFRGRGLDEKHSLEASILELLSEYLFKNVVNVVPDNGLS